MTQKLVTIEGLELTGSPKPGIVGNVVKYTVDLGSTVVVDSNCWMHAWKGTQDVSDSVLSGTMSANGNILNLKTISGELAAEYRYTFKVLIEGNYLVYYFRRFVERESGNK
jgi:hypothetical protein